MESAAKKTSSPVQAVAPETPHESACPTQEQTEEEQKSRKIFGMGGVNPLLGMDPTAMMSQLRAGRLSRSQSTDQVTEAATAQGSEEDVRTWIYTTLNEPVPESDLQPLLKDGQVLCRLINAVRPSSSPVKVNTGKFAFCAMENLNSYLGAATATFGIPRLFEPADVQAGGTFNAVRVLMGKSE
ncbi:calponin homology domain-containing protein [Powellomyces hirtus]|nr:calponin homology domain-containing protein [Powellomyces hirtus]